MLLTRASTRAPRAALLAAASTVLLTLTSVPALAAGGSGGDDEPPEDLTPPVVSVTLPGGANNHWYTSQAVDVTVSATDPGFSEGLASLNYTVTGASGMQGSLVPATSVHTVSIVNEGQSILTAVAEDRVGLTGQASATVRIDRTKPVIDLNGIMPNASYQLGAEVRPVYSCTDATSGVASCAGSSPSGELLDTNTVGARTFQVVARDHAGHEHTVTISYQVVDHPPVTVVTRPSVTGEALPGGVLTGHRGSYDPAPADNQISCFWVRDNSILLGVPATPLTLTTADSGHSFRYSCSVSIPGRTSATATSDPRQVELRRLPEDVGLAVTGVARVGAVLGVRHDPLPAGTVRYWWSDQDGENDIPDAATYRVSPALLGHRIELGLGFRADGYVNESRTTPVGTIAPGRLTLNPTLTGGRAVGDRLSVAASVVDDSGLAPLTPVTTSVQWLRDGVAIPGATAASYQLTAADAGRQVAARLTGSAPAYDTTTASSAAVAVSALPATVRAQSSSPRSRTVRLVVTVTAPGVAPSGTVTVRRGTTKVGTATLRSGRATLVLKRQKPGKARYTVTYGGGSGAAAAQTSLKVVVKR